MQNFYCFKRSVLGEIKNALAGSMNAHVQQQANTGAELSESAVIIHNATGRKKQNFRKPQIYSRFLTGELWEYRKFAH